MQRGRGRGRQGGTRSAVRGRARLHLARGPADRHERRRARLRRPLAAGDAGRPGAPPRGGPRHSSRACARSTAARCRDFDAVSYDLFDFMVSQRIALAQYREWRAPLNSDSGFYADLLQLHDLQAPRTTKDYENYIARLGDVPRYFRENIANMRQGIADGFVLPAEIMPGIASVIAGAQYAKAEDSPFWIPFAEFPAGVPEADRARLAAAGTRRSRSRSSRPTRSSRRSSTASTGRRRASRSARPTCRTARRTTPTSCATSRRCPVRRPRRSTQTGPRRSRADPRRDGGDRAARSGFTGSFDEFLAFLRTRPAVLREDARADPLARRVDHARDRRPHAGFLRTHSARAVHGEARAGGARAELHGRPLQPGAARRGRRILGQHVRAARTVRSTCCRR